jgi:hypothetical protein
MNPIEKKALEMAMSKPLMVEYFISPQYAAYETYSTGQEKRRERREQKRKGKK